MAEGTRAFSGLWLGLVMALSMPEGFAGERPNLGQSITPDEIDTITVFPDGRGLPPGSGTVAQGARIYQDQCMACHGEHGRGGLNGALTGGGQRTIGSYWPYAPTLFDYVRRAMPYQNAGSLSADEIYAVVAYLLFLNGLWGEQDRLDEVNLRDIVMPNRKNFTSTYELP